MTDLTLQDRQEIQDSLESHKVNVLTRAVRSYMNGPDASSEDAAAVAVLFLDFELSMQFNAAAASKPLAKGNRLIAALPVPDLTVEERLYVQRLVESKKESILEKELSHKELAKDWRKSLSSSQPKAPYFLMPATAKDIVHYDQLLALNAATIKKLKAQAKATPPGP